MALLTDSFRVALALVLCALALAAVVDRHQGLLAYLGRVAESLLRALLWAATFGRVRLPQIVRTSRRRSARRRRQRSVARQAPSSTPAPASPTWQVGRQPSASDWSSDDAPPGLG